MTKEEKSKKISELYNFCNMQDSCDPCELEDLSYDCEFNRMDDKKSMDSMLALALGSGVIGFLAQSMFDYTFYNYRVMAVFFMVLGLGLALKHLKTTD